MKTISAKLYTALKAAGTPEKEAKEVFESIKDLQISHINTRYMLWFNIAFNLWIMFYLLFQI